MARPSPLVVKMKGLISARLQSYSTYIRQSAAMNFVALRTVAPFAKNKTGYNVGGWFNNFNAGKLSLTLNLNLEEGQELAQRHHCVGRTDIRRGHLG